MWYGNVIPDGMGIPYHNYTIPESYHRNGIIPEVESYHNIHTIPYQYNTIPWYGHIISYHPYHTIYTIPYQYNTIPFIPYHSYHIIAITIPYRDYHTIVTT